MILNWQNGIVLAFLIIRKEPKELLDIVKNGLADRNEFWIWFLAMIFTQIALWVMIIPEDEGFYLSKWEKSTITLET